MVMNDDRFNVFCQLPTIVGFPKKTFAHSRFGPQKTSTSELEESCWQKRLKQVKLGFTRACRGKKELGKNLAKNG